MTPRLPRTLRGRLVASTVLFTLVGVTALVVLTQVLLAHASAGDARALVRARAEGAAATVRVHRGRLVVLEGTADVLDRTAWVFDARGGLLDGTLPNGLAGPAHTMALVRLPTYRTTGTSLLYGEPLTVHGHRAAVVAVADLTASERSEQRTLWATVLLGLVTIVVAGVVAREVARRSLAVVRDMSVSADAWQEHDLDRRFALGPPRDEITALGHTLDGMLDRIRTVLAAERRLTDEIAHELRTPLTVVRGEAQLARLTGDGLRAEGAEAILEAADRMEAAIRTLLDAARVRELGEGSCRIRDAVAGAVAGAAAGAAAGVVEGADVVVTVPEDLRVGVPQELVVALLGPLVDNARRHARTRVEVRATSADATVEVAVLDDGPGIDPGDTEAVFQPGWSRGGGHGLGLAVVRRLARTAGVEVRAVGAGHGELVVTLPRR